MRIWNQANGMDIRELLAGLPVSGSVLPALTVTGLCANSRSIRPGELFVARQGSRSDGRAFIAAAAANGAAAVLSALPAPDSSLPVFVLPDLEDRLWEIARRFYNNPSSSMHVIGVTGTNGKTSTTFYLQSILQALGMPCGLIGTIEYRIGAERLPAPNTTPDALELYRLLALMRERGMRAVVMEVSSHALVLKRAHGLDFDTAVFTNITEDHLDFHHTMDAYLDAKLSFLDVLSASAKAKRRICYNAAIQYGERVRAAIAATGLPAASFGIETGADFDAREAVADLARTFFRLVSPLGEGPINLAARGYFTIENALAAIAASAGAGATLEDCQKGLAAVRIPGRFEVVENDKGFLVLVDYAHTDDALANLLGAARRLSPRRILTVFGCGGDRDRGKRPLMGEVAARLSDLVFVTSDNPRSEDPQRIIDDILVGVQCQACESRVIVDRAEAIEAALHAARPGDLVLIAGKGHEDYQIFADRTIHFSDRETAAALLERL